MIPFSFFATQQLSSGVVRVNFGGVSWTPMGDLWTYTIPRYTHKSGLYPRTHIVDDTNHLLTGIGIEYSSGGDVKLVAITPISNFVAYFYGDNTEQPPVSTETFMFQNTSGGVYLQTGGTWFYNNGSQSWSTMDSNFAPSGEYKQMTSRAGKSVLVTMDGVVYVKESNATSFVPIGNLPTSIKKVSLPDNRPQSFPYAIYALGENGEVYGINGSTWTKFNFPESISTMALNGACLLLKSVSNKVYAFGYNAHTEFPYYDVDPVSNFYILKKSNAVGDFVYVSEIGQCGITCLFKFVDDGKWYRTGLYTVGYEHIPEFDGMSLNDSGEIPYTYIITSGYGVNVVRTSTNNAFLMQMDGSWKMYDLPELFDGACSSGDANDVMFLSLADHSGIHRYTVGTVPTPTFIQYPV